MDRIGAHLRADGVQVLRGPQAMPPYGPTYHTVDFRDPDGFVLEVAHDAGPRVLPGSEVHG